MVEYDFLNITKAAYNILDFLPEDEPLKNRAKDKVLAILENLTLLQGMAEGNPTEPDLLKSYQVLVEKTSGELKADIGILENYLAVAKSQKWISDTNFLIISTQYRQLKDHINLFLPSQALVPRPKAMRLQQSVSEVKKEASSSKALHRQAKILEILATREKAQVADFIQQLPNVTKRTIRRDLNDLLALGKVVRVGEWNQVFYQKTEIKLLN